MDQRGVLLRAVDVYLTKGTARDRALNRHLDRLSRIKIDHIEDVFLLDAIELGEGLSCDRLVLLEEIVVVKRLEDNVKR